MFVIVGRYWSRPGRSGGGIYHKVRVWEADGEEAPKFIGTQEGYGYDSGNACLQTALQMLIDCGYFPKTGARTTNGFDADLLAARDDMYQHPEKYFYIYCDVPCERDL